MLIHQSLPSWATAVRPGGSGDFYSQNYHDAWIEVARWNPHLHFYWYTKSLPFWRKRLRQVGTGHEPGKVSNVVPTASWGGKYDHLIDKLGLRSARVVYSREEAALLGLEIDEDESLAMKHGPDFALLLHGAQPAGSDAARSLINLKKRGDYGHGKKADRRRLIRLEVIQ